MSYFPMFIDLAGERCLVIGGGEVAYRKISVLLEFGAEVTVIAKKVEESVRALETRIELIEGSLFLEENDERIRIASKQDDEKREPIQREVCLKEYKLVVLATDDSRLNHTISALCRKKRIPVNVVDQKEECSFIFPSYFQKGKLTVAVTTSGSSPFYAAKLRERFASEVPDMTEAFLEQMSLIREDAKRRIPDGEKRGSILKRMVLFAMEQNRILTDEEIELFFQEKK